MSEITASIRRWTALSVLALGTFFAPASASFWDFARSLKPVGPAESYLFDGPTDDEVVADIKAIPAHYATMYLKAAGGNWTAAGTWSATSAAGVDSVGPPLASTDCIAELTSGALTINSGAVCRSFNTTSGTGTYGGAITHSAAVTWTIGDGTAGVGNVALKLNSGVTYTLSNTSTSAVSFVSTSATQQTIDFGGKGSGNVTINGAGSSYQLASDVTMTAGRWTYTAGTSFDANGKVITSSASAASPAFAGGGKTYFSASITTNSTVALTITGANTFTNLSLIGNSASKSSGYSLSASQTVTGTNMPTLTGNSVTNRLLITSDVRGTPRTITNTSTTPAVTNCDFEDITFSSTVNLSAVTGNTGDCGGNTGITFTSPQTNYYQSSVSDNFSTTAKWFLATNGGGGAGRVPLPQDTGFFDANSVTASGKTITQDMPRMGAMTWSSPANAPALGLSVACTIYGTMVLSTGMTLSGSAALTFATHGALGITSAGLTFANAVTTDAPGGAVTYSDAFICTAAVVHTRGGHTVPNVAWKALTFASNNSNTRTITQGSVTPILTGNAATIWNMTTTTNCTFTTRPAVSCSYSGATGTRTIAHAGTESNALSVSITAGTDTISLDSFYTFYNIDTTGFSGVIASPSNGFTVYGSLTTSGTTTVNGNNVGFTFGATSGTQVVTTNGANVDCKITINCPGATVQLAGTFAQGTATSRSVTWTAGAVDLQSFTWTDFGTWTLASTGTRVLSGTGTLALSIDTAVTPWTYSGSNFSVSGTPTIKYTSTTNNAQTFAGGGASYSTVTFDRGASTAAITISGSNTYLVKLRDLGTAAHTLTTAAGTTQTMADFDDGLAGRGTNVLTYASTTTGTYAWTKTGGGTILMGYGDFAHMVARPWSGASGADTWYAGTHSTNNQVTATAGSGVIFTAPPATGNFGAGFFTLAAGS